MTCDHGYKKVIVGYQCLECKSVCLEDDWAKAKWQRIGLEEENSRLKLQLANTMRDYADTVTEMVKYKKDAETLAKLKEQHPEIIELLERTEA